MAVIMITHDLGVVAEVADRVMVMYAGQVVESGTLDQIFYDPQHPYTWGLLGSLTRIDQPRHGAARADRRPAAVADRPAERLPLPQPLPARVRQVQRDAARSKQRDRRRRPHATAAGSTPSKKKTLRVVETGEIGLEAPGRRRREPTTTGTDAAEIEAGDARRRRADPRRRPPRQALPDQGRGSSSTARSAPSRRSTTSPSRSTGARRSASSASRAAASRRSPARSCS